MIPLTLKLKKQIHKNVAVAQDLIIKEMYGIFEKAVLHGGTAIWRCYSGNRFSEDINVYVPKDAEKIETLFENLKRSGFTVERKKIGDNSLYSNLELNRTIVRFEALFKKEEGILKEYETADGNLITVYTLSPETLVKEKVRAYLNRLKIRDLYDVFFLLRHIEDKSAVSKELHKLINGFKNPADEKELKILIIEGLVPSSEKMIEYIKRTIKWESKNI